jgi:hypothetical protein
MSVLRPRNRLVNFRLSEDEFEKLKASCEAFGARSISDFARSSVLSRLGTKVHATPGGAVPLGDKVSVLETRVDQLMRLIEATSNHAPADGSGPVTAQETQNSSGV